MIVSILTTTIIILMILISAMLAMKFNIKKKMLNLTPFECGFNMIKFNTPLSIQFTLITFIFLIFDIELSIIIMLNFSPINYEWIKSLIIFMIMMILSIAYEINKNSMQWIN